MSIAFRDNFTNHKPFLYHFFFLFTGRKSSGWIPCGNHVCNIDRTHCPNDTDIYMQDGDVTSDYEEVIPLPLGVSFVIIIAVLLLPSLIAAALFWVLVKIDVREELWRIKMDVEVLLSLRKLAYAINRDLFSCKK